MASLAELIFEQLDEFKKMDSRQIKDLDQQTIVRRLAKDGRRYYIEVHGRKTGDGSMALMIQCSRDLPFIRWFSQARYFLLKDNNVVENAEPW